MEWQLIEHQIKTIVSNNTKKKSDVLRKEITEKIFKLFLLEKNYRNLCKVNKLITRYFVAYNIVSHKSLN